METVTFKRELSIPSDRSDEGYARKYRFSKPNEYIDNYFNIPGAVIFVPDDLEVWGSNGEALVETIIVTPANVKPLPKVGSVSSLLLSWIRAICSWFCSLFGGNR